MEVKEELQILLDDGNVIKFNEITTKTDNVSREEAVKLQAEIEALANQLQEVQYLIEEKRARLDYVLNVVKFADEEKERLLQEQIAEQNEQMEV